MVFAADDQRERVERAACHSALAAVLACVSGCTPDVVAVVGVYDDGDAAHDGALSPGLDTDAGAEHCPVGPTLSQAFGRALCTCEGLTIATLGLWTDAVDSRSAGAGDRMLVGGDVGINGDVVVGPAPVPIELDIGGNLTVARALGPLYATTPLRVRGDLRVGGALSYEGSVEVAGDVWLAGDLNGPGALNVGGDLRQATAGARDVGTLLVTGRELREPVTVAPPCACGDGQVLEIGALVADAALRNDNAATGFDTERLAAVLLTDSVELPPGRSFVSSIDVTGELALSVRGHSALFVQGDVWVTGSLLLTIAPEASLELFVAGDISLLGFEGSDAAARPEQFRIYAARDRTVSLGALGHLVGLLYAPQADVTAIATSEITGSVLARALASPKDVTIHYDRALSQQHACLLRQP